MERCVCIQISGARALFHRPEFRRDRVTYDVITPAAAYAILNEIHWRPAISWKVRCIHILKPIVFEEIIDRGERRVILRDVAYAIEGSFIATARAGANDELERHAGMFRRRVRLGVEAHLGEPQYEADLKLLSSTDMAGLERAPINADLGWMLHSVDYGSRGRLNFFRAKVEGGVLRVPDPRPGEIFT